MMITRICPMCGRVSTISCSRDGLDLYNRGALAQVAFPEMDIKTRETFISGMCVSCQGWIFGGGDDDDCDGDSDCDACQKCASF